jgi:hypothetical protein
LEVDNLQCDLWAYLQGLNKVLVFPVLRFYCDALTGEPKLSGLSNVGVSSKLQNEGCTQAMLTFLKIEINLVSQEILSSCRYPGHLVERWLSGFDSFP